MTKKAAKKAAPKAKAQPQQPTPQKQATNPGKLAVEYDAMRDILMVEGVQYSGSLFRDLGGLPVSPLAVYRIRAREYGEGKLLELTTIPDDEVRKYFDQARLEIARAADKSPDALTAALDKAWDDLRHVLKVRP